MLEMVKTFKRRNERINTTIRSSSESFFPPPYAGAKQDCIFTYGKTEQCVGKVARIMITKLAIFNKA